MGRNQNGHGVRFIVKPKDRRSTQGIEIEVQSTAGQPAASEPEDEHGGVLLRVVILLVEIGVLTLGIAHLIGYA